MMMMIYAVSQLYDPKKNYKKSVVITMDAEIDSFNETLRLSNGVSNLDLLNIGDMIKVTKWYTPANIASDLLEKYSAIYVEDECTVKLLTAEDLNIFLEL